MKEYNPVEVLQRYREGFPTQQEAAAKLGVSGAYLSDLLQGRRTFSDRILAALKLKRVVVRL